MTRWFRVYDDILDDPKVQLLTPELFKTWVNLLAVASRNGGKLPPAQQLAFALRLGAQDMQARLDELILAGLIDITTDGMEPHNWSKRQWKSDDSADRVRRHRTKKAQETQGNGEATVTERDCNVDVTVTVTPPDTESDTDTEREDTPLPPLQGGDPVALYEKIVANSQKNVANSPKPRASSGRHRGERLPSNWQLPPDWREWARVNCFADDRAIADQADVFRDYWVAKAGPHARKLDWQATWRLWCRRAFSSAGKHTGTAQPSRAALSPSLAAIERLAQRGTA